MTRATILGEEHNCEEFAANNQRFIEVLDPDAIFFESNLSDDESKYLKQSLEDYGTVSDLEKITGEESGGLDRPLYSLDLDEVDQLLEELEDEYLDGSIEEYGEMFDGSATIVNDEVDRAFRSLIHHRNVREDPTLSTSFSRMVYISGIADSEVHCIDSERERIWDYGARVFDDLPDKAEQVRRTFFEYFERDDMDGLERTVTQFLDNSNMWIRNPGMSDDIELLVEEHGYEDVAAVVGKYHSYGISLNLNPEYDVRFYELGPEVSNWRTFHRQKIDT